MSDLLQMQRVDHTTLRILGELDISSTDNVRSRLLESLGELSSGTDLTLDLSGLRFIDCSGIHCLLQAAAALDDEGVLVLLKPPPPVLRVLQMLRVQDAPHVEIRAAEANEPALYQKRSNVSSDHETEGPIIMMTESKLMGTSRFGSKGSKPKSQAESRWLQGKNYEALVAWRRDFKLRHPEAPPPKIKLCR